MSAPLTPNTIAHNTLDRLERVLPLLDDNTLDGIAKRKRIESRMQNILGKMHESNSDEEEATLKRQKSKSSAVDKDAQDLRTRCQELVQDTQTYLYANDFVTVLTSNVERGAKAENAALHRLLQGFSDDGKHWRAVLEPLAVSCDSWVDRCRKHRLNDVSLDEDKQLFYYEQTLQFQATGAHVVRYVDHVIHIVETLKFIKRWNLRESKGVKKWKSDLIQSSFRASSPQNKKLWTTLNKKQGEERQALKSAMKSFRSDHARRITTYNNLESVYDMFGPGVFLDFFWAPEIPKSKAFRPLLEYLRKHMPTMTIDDNPLLSVYNYRCSADSLYQILKVLAGADVADFIQDFMKENPPYLPKGSPDFTWGLDDVQ
ncbi:hypothetical protein CPB85DRAFT_754089 [Mucidula mucida]|nr:hypothetical protein CPB85DRAFT_754089 [Mucidula mucida]